MRARPSSPAAPCCEPPRPLALLDGPTGRSGDGGPAWRQPRLTCRRGPPAEPAAQAAIGAPPCIRRGMMAAECRRLPEVPHQSQHAPCYCTPYSTSFTCLSLLQHADALPPRARAGCTTTQVLSGSSSTSPQPVCGIKFLPPPLPCTDLSFNPIRLPTFFTPAAGDLLHCIAAGAVQNRHNRARRRAPDIE